MSLLPTEGQLHWNGYDFPVETRILTVSQKPHYDPSNRSVMWVEYLVQLESYILAYGGQTIDATMQDLRRRLSKPGGYFLLTGKGFGRLEVNRPGRAATEPADSQYGPL